MPPSPRKGTVLKSRQTYGRQRSFVGQDRDTSPSREASPSPSRNPSSVSSPGLKRGGSDLDAPPALKRAGSTIGSRASLIIQDQAALKASHELREAGQNHQFRDEIEYILDGIRTKDKPKIRRTSCLDLVRSMLKQEFASLFRSCNYMPVIFETIRTDRDPIVFFCLVLMIAISLQEAKALKDIVSIDHLLQVLIQSLDIDIDPMATMPTARQELIMASGHYFLCRKE
ncbi:MAG: wings apart-like protein regulation of heterochromatin-domain-containing protein [Linnemannia gamsii]|nr:MAG: wings apart-like protein regulation of heterochromatin-domain-containing protein [Linnemannia gamsii]